MDPPIFLELILKTQRLVTWRCCGYELIAILNSSSEKNQEEERKDTICLTRCVSFRWVLWIISYLRFNGGKMTWLRINGRYSECDLKRSKSRSREIYSICSTIYSCLEMKYRQFRKRFFPCCMRFKVTNKFWQTQQKSFPLIRFELRRLLKRRFNAISLKRIVVNRGISLV